MKKVRRILCGALAALLLAGCFGGNKETEVITAATNEERVAYLEALGWQVEPQPIEILPAGENAVYAPVSLYLSLGMLTELTEGRTKEQVTELLGVSDSETLRQWTQSLWRQLYCDEKDSALWLGNAAFLNETIRSHWRCWRRIITRPAMVCLWGQAGRTRPLPRGWIGRPMIC